MFVINHNYKNIFEDKCEFCKEYKTVKWRVAMTQYYWDKKEEDPNRDLLLCDDCWQQYYDYYDELWKEYYSGRL